MSHHQAGWASPEKRPPQPEPPHGPLLLASSHGAPRAHVRIALMWKLTLERGAGEKASACRQAT